MVNFVLEGLNQVFTLDVSGALAGEAPVALDVSCVSVYNVKLSDMRNVFKFQTDSFDVNNVDASDIKYYVYMSNWPANLKLNPVHAGSLSSSPILATGGSIVAEKNLVKHDFVRYLAEQLFNTPHGVDLFSNEDALLSDLVSKGTAARQAIDASLNAVNQANAANGTAPNKYSTNALSPAAANFSRVLMRQIANEAASRFATEISNSSDTQSVPLMENDTISFKVSISPAANQHDLTGRPSAFKTRVYEVKLVLKADVDATNTAPTEADSTAEYPYHGA
jgi:hypothetical protein